MQNDVGLSQSACLTQRQIFGVVARNSKFNDL